MPRKGPLCADCGKQMWGGSGVLPQGQAVCQPCRRLRPGYDARPSWTPAYKTCVCGVEFMPRHHAQRYCTPEHSPTRSNRPHLRAEDRGGRYGHAYRKLKAQVFSEETECWRCGFEVDFTLEYPDPMSKSLDHVVQVAHGGARHDRANARLAHLVCNQRRKRRLSTVG